MTGRERELETVIAAVNDDEQGSSDALHLADLIAKRTESRLGVASVLEYVPLPIDDGLPYDEMVEQHFDRRFAAAVTELGHSDFDRHELHGRSPGRALTELAEDQHPDLLVLGRRTAADGAGSPPAARPTSCSPARPVPWRSPLEAPRPRSRPFRGSASPTLAPRRARRRSGSPARSPPVQALRSS